MSTITNRTRATASQNAISGYPNFQQPNHPPHTAVRLPCVNAPTGRSLHNDEWVEVQWTVAEPDDNEIPDKVARRHKRLLRLLHEAKEQDAAPTVGNLAEALDVGRATIKRDLATLRQSGYSVTTRGSRASGEPHSDITLNKQPLPDQNEPKVDPGLIFPEIIPRYPFGRLMPVAWTVADIRQDSGSYAYPGK